MAFEGQLILTLEFVERKQTDMMTVAVYLTPSTAVHYSMI